MPSGSPSTSGVSGGVTSSHHHYHRHHHHLATTVTTSSSSSSSMSSASVSGQHQQLLSRTNLYIRGLKPETTDKDLVTLCQQFVLNYLTLVNCASAQRIVARGIMVLSCSCVRRPSVRGCVRRPETLLTRYLAENLTHFHQTYNLQRCIMGQR